MCLELIARSDQTIWPERESKRCVLLGNLSGVSKDPLQHMRERIDMCRRLAKSINDQDAARILRDMADQGEIDLKQLLEDRGQDRHQE